MLLKFAIKNFIEEKKLNNVSGATMERYVGTTSEFHAFYVEEEIVNVEEVTATTIKKYLLHCQEKRNNNTVTKNSKLRVLKTFFNFLVESEFISTQQNAPKKISYAKEDVVIQVYSDYHIQQMLAYYRQLKNREKSFFAYRDYALILFLLSTGARVGEASNLKWSEVDFDNKAAVFFGKGRKQQSVPLVEKLLKELAEWQLFQERCLGQKPLYVFSTTRIISS